MQTIINGRAYDFSAVIIRAKGVTVEDGVAEIAYKDSMERGSFYGTSRRRRARTGGKYSCEGSWKLLRVTHVALVAALGGDGFMDVEFEITVSYADQGQPVITDTLTGVLIASNDVSASEGTDAIQVSSDLDIDSILWNGVNPLQEKAQ